MRLTHRSALLAAVLGAATLLPAGALHAALVLPRPSPTATVKQTIGITDLTIAYSRPGVKARPIWGSLVPYDAPWRTGANEATTLTITGDIVVADKTFPAGRYSLVTIPTAGDWTFIFSTQDSLMGTSNYDPKKDHLRITVKPELNQPHQEWLSFTFENLSANSGDIVMKWDKLKLTVPFSMDVNSKVLANIRTEIAAAKPDDWRVAFNGARWSFDNNVALAEARGWLDKSIGVQKTHANLNLKARWLHKEGKKAEAIAAAKDAVATGKASKDTVDTSATETLLAEWTK